MKLTFQAFWRAFLILLAGTLAWGVWASAQTATNSPAVRSTNETSALVQGLERLEERHLTFGLDRIQPLRDNHLLGEPLWKYGASLAYLLLAVCLAWLIDFITRIWLKRLTSRGEMQLNELLFELFRGPIKVVAFAILVNIGLNIFKWSETAQVYLSKGLILVVAGSLTWLAVKVVDVLLDVWRRHGGHEADRKFNEQLFSFLRKSQKFCIIIVAILVTAQNMGINITAAITSLSIGGLALGLAAQDTLANLFGAVAVFMDKPFRLGDQIKLDAAEGKVEAVGLRSTRLRNPEGHLVTVPNKTLANAAITNITERPSIKTVMNLTLPNSLPTAKVKRALAILHETYRQHPMTLDVWVSFNQFAGTSLNVLVVHWWKGTDSQKHLADLQELNLAVKERLDAEAINLA
jgi:MscS family membrane protein